jgi:hypothetical protein
MAVIFPLAGMAQGTNASITGRVVDASNEPVVGASVVVKHESTGFTTGAVTNLAGEYALLQLPLGAPYSVSVSFLGYGKQQRTGFSLGQGDVVTVHFTLSEDAQQIAAVEVVANSLRKSVDRLGSSTSIRPSDLKTLPVNGRGFTNLMSLSPLTSGSNIAGQLASSTSYTIDGMTARGPLSGGMTNRGPYLLSMEAIREFEVVSNAYDVSLGRAGGGDISSVTKSGTNLFTGSAFVYHRDDNLSSGYDANGNQRTNEFSTSQYGFSLGGPIIKDRMHFFVSWDHQRAAQPLYIAFIENQDDEIRQSVSQATLDRFLDIARSQYGVANTQQLGSFDKVRPSNSLFARVDWQLNATNLLTLRNNFNKDVNTLGVGDNSRINLYEVYGTHTSQDNSFLASLRSVLGIRAMNEAKFQYLYTNDDGRPNKELPTDNIPRAIVENVVSTIDGKDYQTTIQLGGQRYLPEIFVNNVFQFVDNLYYSTGKLNYTFGVDLMYTHLNSKATSEMNGRFFYRGMDAFLANEPYRYAREIPVSGDPTVKQGVLNAAAYAQLQLRPFRGGSLSVGLRLDNTGFMTDPADDPLLTSELGLKTNNRVNTFQVQPRLQLTWDINEKQTDILRLGAGIFGSNLNNYSMVNNLEFDGQRVIAFDRTAVSGESLGITPNFPAYRKDPASAPGVELFDQFGVQKMATYNINSDDVKVPTVYKFNLSYNRFFSDRLRAGITFYGTFARNNYMYVDRNMADQPFFRLANEGGRGVFVPAASINPATGMTDWMQGRKSTRIGRVLELISEGKNDTYTAVADVAWRYFRDGQINASYTWNDSRDNTSYNGNVANSATMYQMVKDDPRDLSTMAYSDGQFRSKVVVYGSSPTFYGFVLGVRYTGMGGTRYSLAVNGNINGDFVAASSARNDLAFVFDPNDPATPEHLRTGINDLLADPEVAESFKTYLRDNFGRVAERNGGINGFNGTWDIRLSKRFNVYRKHGLELSCDVFNLANLIDKTKGVYQSLGTVSLYNLNGFDPVRQEYIYRINNSAGKTGFSGTVWQIQLGLKYSF